MMIRVCVVKKKKIPEKNVSTYETRNSNNYCYYSFLLLILPVQNDWVRVLFPMSILNRSTTASFRRSRCISASSR